MKSAALIFRLSQEGELWKVESNSKSLSTELIYISWLYLIKTLIERPDIEEDKKDFLRNVQAVVLSSADNLATKGKERHLRVVTVYSRKDGRYMALEYQSSAGGIQRTGWGVIDTYDRLIAAIHKEFGPLNRIPRDVSDAKDVLENWI